MSLVPLPLAPHPLIYAPPPRALLALAPMPHLQVQCGLSASGSPAPVAGAMTSTHAGDVLAALSRARDDARRAPGADGAARRRVRVLVQYYIRLQRSLRGDAVR